MGIPGRNEAAGHPVCKLVQQRCGDSGGRGRGKGLLGQKAGGREKIRSNQSASDDERMRPSAAAEEHHRGDPRGEKAVSGCRVYSF